MKMRLIVLCILFAWIKFISSEQTTREKIELHKAWLEKRATLKLKEFNNMTTSPLYMLKKRLDPEFNKFNKNDVMSFENNNMEKVEEIPRPAKKKTAVFSEVVNKIITTTELMPKSNVNTFITKPMQQVNTNVLPTALPPIIKVQKNVIDLQSHRKVRFENQKKMGTLKHQMNVAKKYERNSVWGTWQSWSNCSRICGGGVMSQVRNCLFRNSRGNKLSNNCIGLHKRYRICNEQSCPDLEFDFREQQCANFNNQTFKRQRYEWEAYIKDDAECELNCKPIGMNYFATLRDKVIDGTPCSQPADYLNRNYDGKAICVDGVCKAVHSSGIITGAFMNNGAVRCGHLICRPVTGLYTKDPLPKGYVHIATIPAGASNISITELKNSINMLALKYSNQKFIINGDYTVTMSGVYEAAGATFDYRRIDALINGSSQGHRKVEGVTEWITCTGPISEPVHLMVLAQDRNPGIKYEYLLPINVNGVDKTNDYNDYTSSEVEEPTTVGPYTKHTLKSGVNTVTQTVLGGKYNDKRKRRFFWKVVGFTACNKSCGGGTQSPVTRCVRENPIRYFKPKRCAHLPKPVLNDNVMRCNTQPCPGYWKVGEWGKCSCSNSNEVFYQDREIKCVQEISPAMVIQVPIVACAEAKPATKQTCECVRPQEYQHRLTSNGITSIKNRMFGVSKNPMVIYGNSSISKRTRPLEMKRNGIWLTSEWNQECSTNCDDGVQYRSIFCDRSPPQIDRCDPRYTPDTTRQCSGDNSCGIGEWFIGPWKQCFGDCFNLSQSRLVYCVKHGNIVNESNCDTANKPTTTRACHMSDVSYCKARWYYSEWTECSKNCAEGTQRRTVKCFEPFDGELRPSDKCKYAERNPGSRSCNTCNLTTEGPTETVLDAIQNDITPECRDELPECHLVIQEHLCQFAYFKEHCCETCRTH